MAGEEGVALMPGERSGETNDQLRQRISRAVTDAELSALEGWEALEVLSNRTDVDGIEVFEDLIRIDGTNFNGPMNVYVVLNYLKEGGEDFAVSEGFPGKFFGRMTEDGSVVIDRISVDTKSFYD